MLLTASLTDGCDCSTYAYIPPSHPSTLTSLNRSTAIRILTYKLSDRQAPLHRRYYLRVVPEIYGLFPIRTIDRCLEGVDIFRLCTRQMISHPRCPRCTRADLLQVREADGLCRSSRVREWGGGDQAEGTLAGTIVWFLCYDLTGLGRFSGSSAGVYAHI